MNDVEALHIQVEQEGKNYLVHASGYLDSNTATDLVNTIRQILSENASRIDLDLEELEYISSAGIGAFVECMDLCKEMDAEMNFAAINEKVRSLFELLGLLGNSIPEETW